MGIGILFVVLVFVGVRIVDFSFYGSSAAKPTDHGKPGGGGTTAPDLSSKLEILGNPAKTQYGDASNGPLDMQSFSDRVYLGLGNIGEEPGTNIAAPYAWYFDPATNQFSHEFTFHEEAVFKFHVFDDVLYVPGAETCGGACVDPTNPTRTIWDGAVYILENGAWRTSGRITNMRKLTDVVKFDSKLFVSGVPLCGVAKIKVSLDGTGTKWDWAYGPGIDPTTSILTDPEDCLGDSSRFFMLGGNLYAVVFTTSAYPSPYYKYTGTTPATETEPMKANFAPVADTFPSSAYHYAYFDDKTLFMTNSGVFAGTTPDDIKSVFTPPSGLLYDITKALDKNGVETIYVLANLGRGSHVIYQSKDMTTWTPLFQFKFADRKSIVQSFESLGGSFYFGIKSGGKNSLESGTIVRVNAAYISGTEPLIAVIIIVALTEPSSGAVGSTVKVYAESTVNGTESVFFGGNKINASYIGNNAFSFVVPSNAKIGQIYSVQLYSSNGGTWSNKANFTVTAQ